MKWKSFLAIILVALLLTACSAHPAITGDAYVPGHDHQVAMMTDRATKMAEGDEGFYYLDFHENQLRHIEKESMEDTLVCNKIDCTHSDADCDAQMNTGTVDGIFLYGDKLYYVTKSALVQRSLDQKSSKVVWEVDWSVGGNLSGMLQHYMLHRGRFYFIVKESAEFWALYEYNLNDGKCKEVVRGKDYIYELKGIGDHIFWLKHDAESTEDTASIVQYHVPSGKIVKEWTDTFSVVPNEENLYFLQLNDTRTNKKLVQTDRVGGNLTETGIEAWTVAVDDTYIYAYDTKVRGWDKTLTIYRIGTWEQVDTIEIPGEQRVFLMPSTDGKIIAWENPAEVKYYLEKDEIGTGNLQWHEIKKIN